jgi:sucrose phosphorylase
MRKIDNCNISNGVMLNAYPDSIGEKLSDAIKMLQLPEFKDVFSLFYILPTFFNSDLDRGFSIIDYNLNKELVSEDDLKALDALNILLKFDIVLNHLSVASPQFRDLLKFGQDSKYKDFFINWNAFWKGHGEKNNEGILIPKEEFLSKLFMRKSGLPILNVPFPDGSKQPYWNTFYQNISFNKIVEEDLGLVLGLSQSEKKSICDSVNRAISDFGHIEELELDLNDKLKNEIFNIVYRKCTLLGQMDVNAKSPLVWDFYDETLAKLKSYGCSVLRLDAFAYLHKEIGETNFFNTPGTWNYLNKIRVIANKYELKLLPEIHAEYGMFLHKEVAEQGYQIYDFFLPGLIIHTLEKSDKNALVKWINEIVTNKYKTVNMLGCHDGIPVLDLKGKEVNGNYNPGLLNDGEINDIMNIILERGGQVKNLYDSEGNKISYYQVNATYFSALGEREDKLLMARAIQLFMPGIPQVWYLDVFAGANDFEAIERSGEGGHKEINRTTLSNKAIEDGLQRGIVINQLRLIKIRNTSNAFNGNITIKESSSNQLKIHWQHEADFATLESDLKTFKFSVTYTEDEQIKSMTF